MPDKPEPSDPTVKTTILPLVPEADPPSPKIKVEPPDAIEVEPPTVGRCPVFEFPPMPPMVPERALVPLSDLAPALLGAFAVGGLTALFVASVSRRRATEA
jgi:hypothetical protein